jgi:hypothetical protein
MYGSGLITALGAYSPCIVTVAVGEGSPLLVTYEPSLHQFAQAYEAAEAPTSNGCPVPAECEYSV